jgi:hypothetical protein
MPSAFDGLLGETRYSPFFRVGSRVQILDFTNFEPDADEGGTWLDTTIVAHVGGGYLLNAPWNEDGTVHVSDRNFGKTWRLKP